VVTQVAELGEGNVLLARLLQGEAESAQAVPKSRASIARAWAAVPVVHVTALSTWTIRAMTPELQCMFRGKIREYPVE
jgi:prophage DNA circulation protein